MSTHRRRIHTLTWLLALALLLGAADEGLAGRKKKDKGKKKKNKQDSAQQAEESQTPASKDAPPKVVQEIDTRLKAYDTAAARGLLVGASTDSSVHLKVAEGRVLEQEAKYADAIQRLSTAATEASSDPAPLVFLGEAYLRTDNAASANDAFARAEQRARAILAEAPADAEALYHLGVAQQRQKKFTEALATLDKARAESPRDAMIHYQIGATQAFQRNWTAAIDALTRAIEIDPGIAYAYYYRGLAAGQAGRKDLLVNDLDRFLAMAPNAPEAEQARRLLGGI